MGWWGGLQAEPGPAPGQCDPLLARQPALSRNPPPPPSPPWPPDALPDVPSGCVPTTPQTLLPPTPEPIRPWAGSTPSPGPLPPPGADAWAPGLNAPPWPLSCARLAAHRLSPAPLPRLISGPWFVPHPSLHTSGHTSSMSSPTQTPPRPPSGGPASLQGSTLTPNPASHQPLLPEAHRHPSPSVPDADPSLPPVLPISLQSDPERPW